MNWQDFTRGLPQRQHAALIIALGAGLQEARHASEVATGNGCVEDAHRHVAAALAQLKDAERLLNT